MAWIESHQDIGQHPKTIALATALNADLATAVGVLHLLWHFALKFSWRTGNLQKYPVEAIAGALGWHGDAEKVIKALQLTGWLDNLRVHDWHDYAGRIVHDRLYNEKRRKTSTNSVKRRQYPATVPDLTVPDLTKETPPNSPPRGAFELLWAKYPNRTGKKAADRHFKLSVKTMTDFMDIQRAMENYLGSDRVKNGFIQNGSTWFNNWRDWVTYTEGKHGTNDVSGFAHTQALARAAQQAARLRKDVSAGKIHDGKRDLQDVPSEAGVNS